MAQRQYLTFHGSIPSFLRSEGTHFLYFFIHQPTALTLIFFLEIGSAFSPEKSRLPLSGSQPAPGPRRRLPAKFDNTSATKVLELR